ncbi:MAG: hypothetical protein GYA55_11505 [SAR324 cluster bacterium]|uniref:Uncharacterized protein n=1 Tax=SAR324 cluster bacterium TaxID=2024889 RepID=A0A7X9IL45_9DELT|nr:hypothetical protein [SAR324 cluster bacterium]
MRNITWLVFALFSLISITAPASFAVDVPFLSSSFGHLNGFLILINAAHMPPTELAAAKGSCVEFRVRMLRADAVSC